MRRQRPGHTLQPTALVNEAFIKLFDDAPPEVADRVHKERTREYERRM
jgi:hypothetical protein